MDTRETMNTTIGPVECRVRWEPDDHPFDWGDIDPSPDERRAVEREGVWGCIVEIRRPACACCGRTDWEHGSSLWGVTAPYDTSYYRTVERECMGESA
jgi:hypothetical protein